MIDLKDFRDLIIRPTLQKLDVAKRGIYVSEVPVHLLLGTILVESQAQYLKQFAGTALGLYQIEPATREDVHRNFITYHHGLLTAVNGLILQDSFNRDAQLAGNLYYATAIARLIYYRQKEALPEIGDVRGYARYYKKYFNTPLGKAKESDFIELFNKHVQPILDADKRHET